MVKKVEVSQGEYQLTGRIPNRKGVITHLQLNGISVYPVKDIIGWTKDGIYTFFTVTETGERTPVTVRGGKFMRSKGNKTTVDNLDYLPVASPI